MNFLQQLDNTPEDQKHALVKGWVDSRSLKFYEELRQNRPILSDPVCTYVAKYEDVMEVLRRPDIFTVDLYKSSMGDYMLAQDDTAIHWREKGIMQSMLNWDDLAMVRQETSGHASKIVSGNSGTLDLVDQYSRLVPALIVQTYFGLNGCSTDDLCRWSYWNQYESFHNQPFDVLSAEERAEIRQNFLEAGKEMKGYLQELLPRRIAEIKGGSSADDILARMLRTQYPPSVGFPPERLARNVPGLLIGTVETTAQAVTQVVHYFLGHTGILEEARLLLAENKVQEFDSYVWEALRFDPVTPYQFRISSQDYTLAKGTSRATFLKAGTMVLPLTLSAMFDENYFPNPHVFTPGRSFSDYLHFGYGMHECLGKYVASVLVPEMVRNIILLPNVRSESPIEFGGTPYPKHYHIAWG